MVPGGDERLRLAINTDGKGTCRRDFEKQAARKRGRLTIQGSEGGKPGRSPEEEECWVTENQIRSSFPPGRRFQGALRKAGKNERDHLHQPTEGQHMTLTASQSQDMGLGEGVETVQGLGKRNFWVEPGGR